MHVAPRTILVIGVIGLILSLAQIMQSPNEFAETDGDIYWGDWIVYQGGNDEIYLDENIGYTVYVDKSYGCSVSVSAQFKGEEHYEAYCDSYYDFDEWMQLGDIYPSGSGYYDIEVEADEFVLVDWTTPMVWNEIEFDTAIGVLGCFISLGVLTVGIILALVLKEKPDVMINQPQDKITEPSNQNWWEDEA